MRNSTLVARNGLRATDAEDRATGLSHSFIGM